MRPPTTDEQQALDEAFAKLRAAETWALQADQAFSMARLSVKAARGDFVDLRRRMREQGIETKVTE